MNTVKLLIIALILSRIQLFSIDTIPGTALQFDGVDEYVNVGNDTSLDVGNVLTIEAWVKPSDLSSRHAIFSTRNSANVGAWQLEVGIGAGGVGRVAVSGHGTWVAQTGDNVIQTGEWYHISYTRSGIGSGTHKIYVNGKEQILISDDPYEFIDNTSNKVIASGLSGGQKFPGQLDEVRFWNVARTSEEILENMHIALSGTETGLVSYWQFNDGTGTVITDCVGTNAGTLVNMEEEDWVDSTIHFEEFTEIEHALARVDGNSIDWGDYDSDGDLDILVAGDDSFNYAVSKIFRNDLGTFVDIEAGLIGVSYSSSAWGDYDNDGDLDILLTGRSGTDIFSYEYISKVYRNDLGIFTDINAGLIGVSEGSVDWGDYDNDGDLDILICGSQTTSIYRNDNGLFTDINAGLIGVELSSSEWGDYDNDGDLDVVLAGGIEGEYISIIYRNDSGVFSDIDAELTGVYKSSVAWGDYDNDGDLDILLTGADGSGQWTRIYRNDSGIFTDINAILTGVMSGSSEWGDYDNDGDLDILICGSQTTSIYRNDSGTFVDIEAGLAEVGSGSAAWGDFDNDGDLDILLTGSDFFIGIILKIYRNNSLVSNTKPEVPSNMQSTIIDDKIHFIWDKATDNETPQNGLSYNIVIGNSEYDVDFKSPMADVNNGYRTIPTFGNICQSLSYELILPPNLPQILLPDYWGLQAIDHSFAGSEFNIQGMDLGEIQYLNVKSNAIMEQDDLLFWEILNLSSVVSYQVQIDNDSLFGDPEVNTVTSVGLKKLLNEKSNYSIALNELTGYENLQNDSTYYWRIKPNYIGGYLTVFTKDIPSFIYNPTYSTPSPIEVTVEGNLVTLTWNDVKDASKGEVYNIYSSDDPYAVFPDGWKYEANVNGTQWLTTASELKKFYCVTATGSSKEEVEKIEINESEETKVK